MNINLPTHFAVVVGVEVVTLVVEFVAFHAINVNDVVVSVQIAVGPIFNFRVAVDRGRVLLI